MNNIYRDACSLVKTAYTNKLIYNKDSILKYINEEFIKDKYRKYIHSDLFKRYCQLELDRILNLSNTIH